MATTRNRTCNLSFTSQTLYRLSYATMNISSMSYFIRFFSALSNSIIFWKISIEFLVSLWNFSKNTWIRQGIKQVYKAALWLKNWYLEFKSMSLCISLLKPFLVKIVHFFQGAEISDTTWLHDPTCKKVVCLFLIFLYGIIKVKTDTLVWIICCFPVLIIIILLVSQCLHTK